MIRLRTALLLGASMLAAIPQLATAGPVNVALGKTVTTGGGTFGGSSSTWGTGGLAMPSTITDGIYVANGQQWNDGTVFWYPDANNSPWIDIDLGSAFLIDGIKLQADNNDLYRISYRNGSDPWTVLADIDPDTAGWGMATGSLVLGAPITASMFRITDGPGGDCCDSVSEFQAYGTAAVVAAPVPEPETYAMMLAGLGLLGVAARRRKNKALA